MGARILKIPEEIVNALRIPPDDVEEELYKELAIFVKSLCPLRLDPPSV